MILLSVPLLYGVLLVLTLALLFRVTGSRKESVFYMREFLIEGFLWMTITLGIGLLLFQIHARDSEVLTAFFPENIDGELKAVVYEVRERQYGYEMDVISRSLILQEKEIFLKKKLNVMMYDSSLTIIPGMMVEIKVKDGQIDHLLPRGEEVHSYYWSLLGKGINNRITLRSDGIKVLEEKPQTSKSWPLAVRNYGDRFFSETLQSPHDQVMKSVLFGNRGFLMREELDLFSKTGTSHLIALSGLHIGLILWMGQSFFALLGFGKNQRLILGVLLMILYGIVAGFPVSLLRGSLLAGMLMIAYFRERPYDGIQCLSVVGILVLLQNPFALFTLSFQLSFMATLGIFILYPRFIRWWRGYTSIPEGVRSLVAVTLSAQLATVPIVAFYFNRISTISLLANLALLPTMALLLTLGVTALVWGVFIPHIGQGIAFIANGILYYQMSILQWMEKVPFAYVAVENVTLHWVLLYYGGMLLAIDLLEGGKIHGILERIQRTNQRATS